MKFFLYFLCFCGWLTSVQQALAHPISMSSAIVDVYEDHVNVEMRILLEDLVMYYNLEPAKDFLIPADALKTTADKHQTFILEYFTIRDADGRKLEGEIRGLDKTQIAEGGVHAVDLMTYAVVYQIHYRMEPNPSHLLFSQNFGGIDATLPAVMDLLVTQKGIITEDPVKISPQYPYTREFDWSKEPEPLPRRWQERRALRDRKEKEFLGITSYSSIYSYIYINQFEVRHELLLPLLTLETWLPLHRQNPDILTVPEQESARERILAFFRENHPVEIDGIRVRPRLDRLSFYGLNFKDFAQVAPPETVSIHTARVGIILSYSTKGTPNDIEMTWELFNESTPFLRSFVYEYENAATQFFFVPDEPSFHWSGDPNWTQPQIDDPAPPLPVPTIKIPLISVGLVLVSLFLIYKRLNKKMGDRHPLAFGGAAFCLIGAIFLLRVSLVEFPNPFIQPERIPTEKAVDLFQTLHRNLYRAFDYREEEDIYQALDHSVDGELLERIYLEVLQSLRMSEQGGARVRIKTVDLIEEKVLEPVSPVPNLPVSHQFAIEGTWDVTGTVEHWGHIHSRKNRYRGVFTVAGLASGWKLVDFSLQSEERLHYETDLRKFN